MFSASWQNLLNAIDKCKKESFSIEKRLLSDIISKLIFVVEKKNKKNNYAWEGDWVNKEIVNNKERMSANHKKDCLNHKGNIQIIYSFPLDRFLDEGSTIETLKEFIEYCNNNGIPELKLV